MRFVEADLFTWEPDRRYDVVFMGFWLSHVPAERFGSFWALVAAALAPQGRVFFADGVPETGLGRLHRHETCARGESSSVWDDAIGSLTVDPDPKC